MQRRREAVPGDAIRRRYQNKILIAKFAIGDSKHKVVAFDLLIRAKYVLYTVKTWSI